MKFSIQSFITWIEEVGKGIIKSVKPDYEPTVHQPPSKLPEIEMSGNPLVEGKPENKHEENNNVNKNDDEEDDKNNNKLHKP